MSDEARRLVRELSDRHGSTLAHYASPYYDPVKAKEYYERTKKLKGRQPATTSTQREGINYANSQIKDAKAKDLNQAQATREQKTAALKAKAEATTKRIKAKLAETIAKKADALFKRIENLPEDADPDLVNKLMAAHSKNANKARQQAAREMQSSMKSIRGAIAKARTNYNSSRDAINKKYDAAKTKEESNIRANVR